MGETRQYLKHGKALCGKVFGGFVDTFNWLVDFATNLSGDADVNEGTGHVSVDNSDPSHPVIRCSGCEGSNVSVSGSDYISLDDDVVVANIKTGVGEEVADDHALLTADTEQKVKSKKIFQNSDGTTSVTMDGPEGKIDISDGTTSVTMDGPAGKLVISNGSKSITLDLNDISSDCNGALGIKELSYVDEDGVTQKYHGLFCDDIDLPEVEEKTIAAGDGISVTESDGTITITNTRGSSSGSGGEGSQSTSGYSGTMTVVTEVIYSKTARELLARTAELSFVNGLLKSVVIPAELTGITQAVEETL